MLQILKSNGTALIRRKMLLFSTLSTPTVSGRFWFQRVAGEWQWVRTRHVMQVIKVAIELFENCAQWIFTSRTSKKFNKKRGHHARFYASRLSFLPTLIKCEHSFYKACNCPRDSIMHRNGTEAMIYRSYFVERTSVVKVTSHLQRPKKSFFFLFGKI